MAVPTAARIDPAAGPEHSMLDAGQRGRVRPRPVRGVDTRRPALRRRHDTVAENRPHARYRFRYVRAAIHGLDLGGFRFGTGIRYPF